MRWTTLSAARRVGCLLAACLCLAACTKVEIRRSAPPSLPSHAGDRLILAGEWEYEDGAVVTLKLDEQGNGPYAWKDGHFETHSLNGRTWEGMWFQKENDREGGFSVELSPDFSEGEGRWWYTRIESNHTPTEKGGTFHLTRKSPHANAGDTPSAP